MVSEEVAVAPGKEPPLIKEDGSAACVFGGGLGLVLSIKSERIKRKSLVSWIRLKAERNFS